MMKIVAGALVGAGAILGWQYFLAPIGDLTASEARTVSQALADGYGGLDAELREPVLKARDQDGWMVCGWVRIGGADAPLGAQPFIGILFDRGTFGGASLPVTQGEIAAVKEACASRGMIL